MNISELYSLAKIQDESDQLKSFSSQFMSTDGIIYLDGNSLGKLPLSSGQNLDQVIHHQWGQRLIRSWNENWIDLPSKTAENIAKILHVQPSEIVVCDNTSVNLFKLAFAALTYKIDRTEIITDENNFPTDHYIFQNLIATNFNDHVLSIIKGSQYGEASIDRIKEKLSSATALLSMSHVLYKSGYLYDMEKITRLAHDHGALTLWDLSHSVGAVSINLHEANVDMAVGCTYKYLNGGPGAPAFIYVKKSLQAQLVNPIAGWFSHEKPFDFSGNYIQSESINKFSTGTPSILSLAPILSSTEITLQAGVKALREKSLNLSSFFITLVDQYLASYNFSICSPRNQHDRGSHISLYHEEAYRINLALISPQNESEIKIIPDYRPPGYIRFGFAPLYNSFENIVSTIIRITSIMEEKEYLNYNSKIEGVT
jgi:kynureninase